MTNSVACFARTSFRTRDDHVLLLMRILSSLARFAAALAYAEQKEIEALEAKLKRRPPGSISETESQQAGWLNDRGHAATRLKTNRRWFKGRGTCDITAYADAYTTMSGQNPFADKSTR